MGQALQLPESKSLNFMVITADFCTILQHNALYKFVIIWFQYTNIETMVTAVTAMHIFVTWHFNVDKCV